MGRLLSSFLGRGWIQIFVCLQLMPVDYWLVFVAWLNSSCIFFTNSSLHLYKGENPVPFNIWINQGSARWIETELETWTCFSIPSSALGIQRPWGTLEDVSEEGDVCDALFTKIRSGRAALVTDDRKGFPVWFWDSTDWGLASAQFPWNPGFV